MQKTREEHTMKTIRKSLCFSVTILAALCLTNKPSTGSDLSNDRIPPIILGGQGSQSSAAVNITGTWHGSDGSKFYVTYKSGSVALYGESSRYARIGTGTISSGRGSIHWHDVPKIHKSGLTEGAAGLRVKDAKRLELVMQGSTVVLTR